MVVWGAVLAHLSGGLAHHTALAEQARPVKTVKGVKWAIFVALTVFVPPSGILTIMEANSLQILCKLTVFIRVAFGPSRR